MVECITNMIVINLRSEDNSDELATVEGLHASTTNESEKGTIDDAHPNVHTYNSIRDSLRSTAIMMKNQKQHNSLKVMKQCGTAAMTDVE